MIPESDYELIAIGYEAGQERRGKIITCALTPVLPSTLAPLVVGYLDVDVNILRTLYDNNTGYPSYSVRGWELELCCHEGEYGDHSPSTSNYLPTHLQVNYKYWTRPSTRLTMPMIDLFRLLIGDDPQGRTVARFVHEYGANRKIAKELVTGLWASLMALTKEWAQRKT
jgi:hypothetical protein